MASTGLVVWFFKIIGCGEKGQMQYFEPNFERNLKKVDFG